MNNNKTEEQPTMKTDYKKLYESECEDNWSLQNEIKKLRLFLSEKNLLKQYDNRLLAETIFGDSIN